MATTVKLDLNGMAPWLEKLATAGRNVDAAVGEALAEGAALVRDDIAAVTPVGQAPEDRHPGNLKANITVDGPKRDGNYSYVEVGLVPGVVDKDTAIYGNVQEYGSASNQAQPYIRPGIDSGKAKARRAIVARLKAEGML